MSELLDSGERRRFDTGAVRDIAEGKGRCDLLPLYEAGEILQDEILKRIDRYIREGSVGALQDAFKRFAIRYMNGIETAVLEVAKQYEDGARKYADRNWEKGIPAHCFIDSGVRHYLKFRRGDTDEPHDRAFLWNILGALWTHENRPDLVDLPFAKSNTREVAE